MRQYQLTTLYATLLDIEKYFTYFSRQAKEDWSISEKIVKDNA